MANKQYLWQMGEAPGFDGEIPQDAPSILHIPAAVQRPHAACLIAPGGGYVYKEMDKEGVRIAQALCAMGISCFVLDYRVRPYPLDCALRDAQRALRLIRSKADHLLIDPNRVGMMGFSAGGHLTCMCSVHFDPGDPGNPDPIERQSSRPDFAVPCYAVTDFEALWQDLDKGYAELGVDPIDAWRYAPARLVREGTPPSFLWHTCEDGLVPVSQSLAYASALSEKGVPFDLHIYQRGPHGIALAQDEPAASQWPIALGNWLRANYFL